MSPSVTNQRQAVVALPEGERHPWMIGLPQRERVQNIGAAFCFTGAGAAAGPVVFIVVQIAVFALHPPPLSVDGFFVLMDENPLLGMLSLDLLLSVNNVLVALVYLALIVVLWGSGEVDRRDRRVAHGPRDGGLPLLKPGRRHAAALANSTQVPLPPISQHLWQPGRCCWRRGVGPHS